jgi:hypothetical protein
MPSQPTEVLHVDTASGRPRARPLQAHNPCTDAFISPHCAILEAKAASAISALRITRRAPIASSKRALKTAAAMGRRDRLQQLGANPVEIRHRPSRGDLRHTRHRQSRSHARQCNGGGGTFPRGGGATADRRGIKLTHSAIAGFTPLQPRRDEDKADRNRLPSAARAS